MYCQLATNVFWPSDNHPRGVRHRGCISCLTRAELRPRFLLCDTPVLGEVRIEIGGFYKSVGVARKHCIDELNGVPTGLVYE
jgi:hypothetical protein